MQLARKHTHTHTHTHTHRASTSCITREIQLKTTRKPTEYLVEWVKLKYLQHQVLSRICNNQSTYTYNATRSLKRLVVFYKSVLILTSRPNISMPKHLPKRNKKCIFYKSLNVHIKFILNSSKLEHSPALQQKIGLKIYWAWPHHQNKTQFPP